MKSKLTLLVSILVLLSSLSSGMTQEEASVRKAYARVAYAFRLNVLVHDVAMAHKAVSQSEVQKLWQDGLTFKLYNFRVGNLPDIANARWETLVTKPEGDIVQVIPIETPYNIKTKKAEYNSTMFTASANWIPWHVEQDWTLPVRSVLPATERQEKAVFTRYAAYTVSVKLHGRSRSYLAMFWFGKDHSGGDAIFAMDHILGMGTLTLFLQRSLYPQALLETHWRELPAVAEWIRTVATESCTTKAPDVCCDASGHCGIPREHLRKSLQIHIDPDAKAVNPEASTEAGKATHTLASRIGGK